MCLKRKIRNFVTRLKRYEPPYDIYVKERAVLNKLQDEALKKGGNKQNAQQIMCQTYYDIRTFGAMMATEKDCGRVKGPVQLTFAKSIDPISWSEHTLTRCAVSNEKDEAKEQTMGRKATVPYGLYMAHGFISAHDASQTGFTEEDLALLWQSLMQMFEHDRSSARGEMIMQAVYVFKHESPLGNAPAHKLFKRLSIQHSDSFLGGKTDEDTYPRKFEDYTVTLNTDDLPTGVSAYTLDDNGLPIVIK